MGYVWYAILLLCCAYVFKLWWSGRRFRELGNKIPGPPTLPLLGNVFQCIGGPHHTFATFRQQWNQHQGRTFRVWIGPFLYVIVSSPEDVETILVNKRLLNRDRYIMKILSKFAGNGLVTCSSKTWKKQRKLVAPSLQKQSLESYIPVFNKQSRILVNLLKEFADGNTFDAMIPLVVCTSDTISESAIGVPLNGKLKEENVAEVLRRTNHLIVQRIMKPWLMFDAIYDLTPSGKEQKKVEELICRTGDNLVRSKLEEYREMKLSGSITDEWMNKGNTIIDHFIRTSETEGTELDEQLLKDEVYTALVAGLDTTATTICFTLVLLALHPTIQDTVVEELKEVFADDWDRDVTSEDVTQMKYLSRVIKEAMRLFPAVTVIAREVEDELELSTCRLPAGCLCLVVSYFVHRDARYFPDPERFDPDRFLPERSKDRHPYSYIPFGAGPRSCVGFKYAEKAMAVMLATVLRKYRVMTVMTHEDLKKLELGLILMPVSDFLIKMLPREKTTTTTTTTDTPL